MFAAVADGRLHLAAVCLLAPHLAPDNADELLAAAAHRTKAELEQLLAERFPRPDVPAQVQALSPSLTLDAGPLSQGVVAQLAPGQVDPHAPGPVEAPVPRPKVTPLAPERFALQLTIGQSTYEKLQYAQALLGHQLAPGDLAAVLDRALDALIGQLEQRKFAATSKPQPRRATTGKRQIPAHVRRTVWARDGGQCTFVGETGQRCPARTRLEFDHVEPVARGGRATVSQIRLHCRAHNQYAAECTFGTAFMNHKRQEAQRAAAARAVADEQGEERDVVPWLRRLGFRAEEARRAALRCESIPDASLEERLRLALSCLRPPHRRVEQGLGRPT